MNATLCTGIVIRLDDPLKKGRVQVRPLSISQVPSPADATAAADHNLIWLEQKHSMTDAGWVLVPDIGTIIALEYMDGAYYYDPIMMSKGWPL